MAEFAEDRREHRVTVTVGDKVIEKWESYEITSDMLQAADGFNLELPGATREVFDLVKPDAAVQVAIDDVPILTGFVDDRRWRLSAAGTSLTITGRDKGGRLVDESAPLTLYQGLGIQQLAEKMVLDWFPKVSLSNTTNRLLVRGPAAPKAKVSKEPAIDTTFKLDRKVNPGESRWDVLRAFLERAELLAWSSANGQEFVVGLPCYTQEPQYRFFVPTEASARQREGNVIDIELDDSVGERYSMIVACGSGRGSTSNYAARVTRMRAVAKNNPATEFGTGKDFTRRKVLLVADADLRNQDAATRRAKREMALRDGTGRRVHVTVRGHAQLRDGKPALYAFDAMCELEIEPLGIRGKYLVTAVSFRHSRREGETTQLTLVPEGTVLRL